MYAHKTRLRVPDGQMPALRTMIESEYLPVVSQRPGFIAAYLLEQVDDEDVAEMIQFWETHAAAEAFTRTGSLGASLQSLTWSIPGTQIQGQGYIVRAGSKARDAETIVVVETTHA